MTSIAAIDGPKTPIWERARDTRTKEIRELRYNKEIEEEIQLWDIELNQWTKIKVK